MNTICEDLAVGDSGSNSTVSSTFTYHTRRLDHDGNMTSTDSDMFLRRCAEINKLGGLGDRKENI